MNASKTYSLCAGIACYNRERLYYKTLESLKESALDAEILIFDDASSSIDHKITLKILPTAKVFVNKANSGRADFAMRILMSLYLEQTKADYLLFLDSDLQISRSLGNELDSFLKDHRHAGVFSLFNTPSHAGVELDERWMLKKTVGAAGSVLARSWVEQILAHVPPSTRFDWDWCEFIEKEGKQILCTRESYVQHLGFTFGQNSRYRLGDYGLNFKDPTTAQLAMVLEQLHHSIHQLRDDSLRLQQTTIEVSERLSRQTTGR